MVLQNGESLPVWGWAKVGEIITIKFLPYKECKNLKQIKKVITGKDGKWLVYLESMTVSSIGAKLTVNSESGDYLEVKDILVGEVWLASGQSNMELNVQDSANPKMEISVAKWPQIRMFTVPKLTSCKPVANVNSKWVICSPETVSKFSAVAYYFAREIHKIENVPVGILHASWGSSRIESWISKNGLLAEETTRIETIEYEKDSNGEIKKRFAERSAFDANPIKWLKKNVVADPGNKSFAKGWADPKFDDSIWAEMKIPQAWQTGGVVENGVVWFRKYINIPQAWVGCDLQITLGACDKHDVTYFNNKKIGSIGWDLYDPWDVIRKYTIPGYLVRKGENLISVRVYSYRNGGGLTGPEADMRLQPLDSKSKNPIDISGMWKYKVEHSFGIVKVKKIEPEKNQRNPYSLFNSMLYPLIPYSIKGFIWYQGEANASAAIAYRDTFPQMIREWRSQWGGRNLPFLFVQLANFIGSGALPLLREAQLMTLKVVNTGMAVTIDIGNPLNIHPLNKQDVGKRLALNAEFWAYGRVVIYSGPMYRNHIVKNANIHIWFDHADGLSAKNKGPILGFTIAGEDKIFVEAQAIIQESCLIITASKVKKPIAVRYAWDDNPIGNLCNQARLPASPFRTDNWK